MRQFWHTLCRLDSFGGGKVCEMNFDGKKILCFPHIQEYPDNVAMEKWLASEECENLILRMRAEFNYTRKVGAALFLACKCPCIKDPTFRACVCEICRQMEQYLEALGRLRRKRIEGLRGYANGISRPGVVCNCEHHKGGELIDFVPWQIVTVNVDVRTVPHVDTQIGKLTINDPLPVDAVTFECDSTYWNMHLQPDLKCFMLRQLLQCPKQRLPDMDVPNGPRESPNLSRVEFYSPKCAIGAPWYDECDKCGFENIIGEPCALENNESVTVDCDKYVDLPRGKEVEKNVADEDNEASGPIRKQRTQRVWKTFQLTGAELWKEIEEHVDVHQPHYWDADWMTVVEKVVDYTFTDDTINIKADYAAQVEHVHDGSLTCATFARSNVEVIVVNHSPRWERNESTGELERRMNTDCWFIIGGTNSRYKEADSHGHNAAMEMIVEHYKRILPNLRHVIIKTDGCSGQYKGRFNFKYLAEFYKKFGLDIRHMYAATEHFKGFHGALGKLIAKIHENAEKFRKAGGRAETSWELKEVVDSTIEHDVQKMGKGMMAINKYYVRYITSSTTDPHMRDVGVPFVERPVKWDVAGMSNTHETYEVWGCNPIETDHVRRRMKGCSWAGACRENRPMECKLTDWGTEFEDQTINYVSSPHKAIAKAELTARFDAFALSLIPGSFIIMGMGEKVWEEREPKPPFRYDAAVLIELPVRADRQLGGKARRKKKEDLDVPAVIEKNRWVIKIAWLDRVIGPDGNVSPFTFCDEGLPHQRYEIDGCVLVTPIRMSRATTHPASPARPQAVVPLPLDDAEWTIESESHTKIMTTNLARFSSYH